ncbi:DNA-packaging protein [Pedobacter antarcticus]|uniref:DNA-packaging protein n=1 Tax=Pedobacter antarcticus TaxID=34086 RepID=UPI001C580655|nr:DNA-packaging protein [Pedobacter antarcticus]
MGAPKKNQFWKMRSTHGRDLLFGSPTLMWEAACDYFDWCVANPIIDPRSFGGKQKIQRPFTMEGLCRFLNCNSAYFRQFKKRTKDKDFTTIIQDIEEAVFQQKFENAAIGVYKENLISRDLGLADKQDVKHDGIPETPAAKQVMIFNGKKVEF